jgi:adenine deaminase
LNDRESLLAVALGRQPADLVVRGGSLANVYTGELLEGWGVAVAGSRIASVGPEIERHAGPATTVIDMQGGIVAPGFIDGHTHLDCIHRLDHYLAAAIPTGLTTLITETSQLSTVGGYPVLAAFIAQLPGLPITVYATAPTISYLLSDRGDGTPMITTEEMARLLEEPGVVGLGEVYWPAILENRAGLRLLLAKAEAMGKAVEGHTAGARGDKLTACVAAGLSSCHESIAAQEIQERLRLGLTTMVRDGSVRRDLGALEGALKGIDPRRLVLVSDTVWAPQLLGRGYLDESARQAVRMGLEPMQALRAITLTPAEHFRIEGLVGGVAPGRRADMVLLPDLESFRPRMVIARGQVVAREGHVTIPIPPLGFPGELLPAPHVLHRLTLNDLRIPAPPGRDRIRVRTIHFAGEIVTQAIVRELPVKGPELRVEPDADLLKVVAIDRRGQGQIARGFVSGYGLRRGALAASLSFDTANLILLGADESDMLMAADRMLAMGGGIVVVADGILQADVPLPLGGIISEQPMGVLADQFAACQRVLSELGCVRANPLLSAQVVTFIAIPALRIRERGLWDVRRNQVVPLMVEGDE